MPGPSHPIAQLADLPPGTMKGVEVDGSQILLVRLGDEILALDGICPHAGAPLAEGVLDGDRVICPWHKAAFCVRRGTVLEPPALDDLRRVPILIRDGAILLAEAEAPMPEPAAKNAAKDARCFAILGAGAAGAVAAQSLRAEGFTGRVVLIDREGTLPYDRTILSKYVLAGTEAGEKSPLQDDAFYRAQGIERHSAEAAALRPAERAIIFRDGSRLDYDAALIATGGVPVPPPFPGADLANVFLLRSRQDADRIVAAAGWAERVVVIGTSFIGMEAAAALRERGLEVVVVGQERQIFEKSLGIRLGGVFRGLHEEKGVVFKMERQVAALEGDTAVQHVLLADGERIPADLVVAGLGVKPATGFLDGLALAEDGGIEVDGQLRIADGLYAAGDIARFPLYGDGPRVRIEHWRVAQQQGRLAARNMLGAGTAYASVPMFWTIQYGQQLDYIGHASGKDDLVIRGDLDARDFIAYFLRDGKVSAAAGMGRDRDMAAVLALMERRRDWTVETLHPRETSPVEVLAAAP